MPPVPPPGRLLRIAGRPLHVQLQPAAAGIRAPTVVLEAALGGSSLGWVYVQRALAGEVPLLSYDRAGLGYSAAGPLPRDLPRLIADLEAVLQATAAAPPYLLVGHSFGALIVRQFAALHPELTAGVILVDPPWLEEWCHPNAESQAKLMSGIRLSRRGMWAARCGIAQFAAWLVATGALQWAARCATLVSGGKLRTAEDFNIPPPTKLPPELKPAMRWFWSRARFYQALASQMESLPAAARAIAAAIALGDIPLTVLSAADTPTAQRAEHQRLAAAAARGRHRVARASGHWIPLEEPDLVVAAIRALLPQSASPAARRL